MSQTHDRTRIGTEWRAFQLLALFIALSWIASYALYRDPGNLLAIAMSGESTFLEAWGAAVLLLSPLLSVVVVILALAPERLGFMSREQNTKATIVRVALFAVASMWMLNVFIQFLTGPSMLDKLLIEPLSPALVLPFTGGVFLHVVFQHWFQALAAIVLAAAPHEFETLIESPSPAGVQYAVVERE